MIIGIIPAAGVSRRMGRPKLLLPWGAGTVLDRVLETLAASRVDRTLVVLPPAGTAGPPAALEGITRRWRAHPVLLAHPTADMLETLRVGIGAAAGLWGLTPSDGLLITPADVPTLAAEVVDRLIDRYAAGAGSIVVPTCAGRRGHPLLLSGSLVDAIGALPGGVGLNALVQRYSGHVVECPVERPQILDDLDTPDDYRRLVHESRQEPVAGSRPEEVA